MPAQVPAEVPAPVPASVPAPVGRATRRWRRLAVALAWGCVLPVYGAPGVAAQDTLPPETLRTPAEIGGFAHPTSHDELVRFLGRVQAVSPEMRMGVFGRTVEGRPLPWAIFSRPQVTTPAEAHASGKPVVVLAANAHGYNHVVREALLVLARELGMQGSAMNDLLDRVTVIVVPTLNPDGFEAGTRPNARGADLNRDYVALDEPETAAFVREILARWDPHLVVDGHDGGSEQYGGVRPYHLLYQGPGLAGADPSLQALADELLLPRLRRDLAGAGFQSFYWSRGDRERWTAGGSAPRMGRNYGGLTNRPVTLFEVAAWAGFETGIGVALAGLRSVLRSAAEEGDALVATVRRARAETVRLGSVPEGQVPVEETMEASPTPRSWQVEDPERPGTFVDVNGALMNVPVGTRFRDRPWGYVLPPGATAAVELLLRHGIRVECVTEDARVTARRYELGEILWEEGANGNRAAPRIRVAAEGEAALDVAEGSWLVRTGQPLGRLVAHLLEPETGDGVFHWGRMNTLLAAGDGPGPEGPHLLPIVRLMAPAQVATWIVRPPAGGCG
jgi:hypothetical protein